jgi:hypothetical protein
MASCLAAIKAQSCDQAKLPPGDAEITELCDGVVEPKVPVGGGCSDSWDCVGGWCAGDAGGLADTCVPLQQNGGECDEDDECASGSCIARACTPPQPGSGNICKLGTGPSGH